MKLMRKVVRPVVLMLVLPLSIAGCAITQPSFRHNERSVAVVDPAALKAHVQKLSSDFYPRSCGDRKNLDLCAAYIQGEFEHTGAAVTTQSYQINRISYQNVMAQFPGKNPARIIVGAHYDACADTPGADDNASGVAGLLELARLLGKLRLDHTIELVAYSTEEPPYFGTDDMGSAHHAQSLHDQGIQVEAMLALEMIGCFSDARGSQSYPALLFRLFYPSRGNFIAVIGNTRQRKLIRKVKAGMSGTSDLPVYSVSVPGFVQGIDFSDHRNYWTYGYPAVMITDTAFYRNKMYHGTGDTPDRLDYSRMAKVVVAVFEAVKMIDR